MTPTITSPGLYDLEFDEYLADPVVGGSLSHSGARTILDVCPAMFVYEREHGRPDSDAFDVGHAAHLAVLGAGIPVAVIPDDLLGTNGSVSTKAAKEFVAEVRARGEVPIKSEVAATVAAMAEELRRHPIAGPLLDPEGAHIEQSAVWRDADTDVMLRARFDCLRVTGPQLVVADYKSCNSAHPRHVQRTVASYDYEGQGAFYLDAAERLQLGDDAAFRLIFQEKTPPYLVTVAELSPSNLRIGRERSRRAIDIYAECVRTGIWPGYSTGIELIEPPLWLEYAYDEEMVV